MGWSSTLRDGAAPIWRAVHAHPFLEELVEGSLPDDRFRCYILNDYPYIKEFCRILALAVTRGRTVEEMSFYADLMQATMTTEMTMHRALCAEMGISPEEMERTRLAPSGYAYTRHLLSVGAFGSQAEMMVALLPCIVGYAEIGRRLGARPRPGNPRYARWIDAYASAEYQELSSKAEAMVDRLEDRVGPGERARCQSHYEISARYEWMFWEMAYRMESWPPEGSAR